MDPVTRGIITWVHVYTEKRNESLEKLRAWLREILVIKT